MELKNFLLLIYVFKHSSLFYRVIFKNLLWLYFSFLFIVFPKVLLLVSADLYLSRTMLCWVTTPVVICEESLNILICGIIPTAVIAVCKFILSTVWSFQPCRRATLSLKLLRHEFYIQFSLEHNRTCYQVLLSPRIWDWCSLLSEFWASLLRVLHEYAFFFITLKRFSG